VQEFIQEKDRVELSKKHFELEIDNIQYYATPFKADNYRGRFLVETRYSDKDPYAYSSFFHINTTKSETAMFTIPLFMWMLEETEPSKIQTKPLEVVIKSLMTEWTPIVKVFELEQNWKHKLSIRDNIHDSNEIHPYIYTLTVRSTRKSMELTFTKTVVIKSSETPGQFTISDETSSPPTVYNIDFIADEANAVQTIGTIYIVEELKSRYEQQYQRLVSLTERLTLPMK